MRKRKLQIPFAVSNKLTIHPRLIVPRETPCSARLRTFFAHAVGVDKRLDDEVLPVGF